MLLLKVTEVVQRVLGRYESPVSCRGQERSTSPSVLAARATLPVVPRRTREVRSMIRLGSATSTSGRPVR